MSRAEEATSEELLARAVSEAVREEEGDEAYWQAVRRFREMGPLECWRLVSELEKDGRAAVRALVPDVLRYFEPNPLREETAELLERMISVETTPLVLSSIALAFVDLRHERAVKILPPLLKHRDPSVRSAAVHGLLPVAGRSTIDPLIFASKDEESDVRNWATFGLRTLLGDVAGEECVDTEEIREALGARLDDDNAETRAEAILGLAIRKDERALGQLKTELKDWPEWDHCLEAAALYGRKELHPLLTALLEKYPEEEKALRPALVACRPDPTVAVDGDA